MWIYEVNHLDVHLLSCFPSFKLFQGIRDLVVYLSTLVVQVSIESFVGRWSNFLVLSIFLTG